MSNSTAINTGAILEALNDKTDRDCKNVDTTVGADAIIDYQIPTAENDYAWYRLYKSGWIEQGGIKSTPTDNNPVQIDFIKTMADSNYYANFQRYNTSTGTIADGYIGDNTISEYTTTYFKTSRGYNGPIRWEVKGMSVQ